MPSFRLFIAAAGLLGVLDGTASAQSYQSCQGRPDFDLCMMRVTQGNMNQLAGEQQRNFQEYVRTNQDWLKANYAEHRRTGGHMSPRQFAEWGLMTANGTNYQGAADMQTGAFKGNQTAHETVAGAYRQANGDWARRSDQTSRIAKNYDGNGVRGNSVYVDPNSGRTVELPYAGNQGQPFNSGGEIYQQSPDGTYYQQRGHYWVQMSPAR